MPALPVDQTVGVVNLTSLSAAQNQVSALSSAWLLLPREVA